MLRILCLALSNATVCNLKIVNIINFEETLIHQMTFLSNFTGNFFCFCLQGSYDVAYEILASAKARFPASSQFSTYWIQCEEQLNFTLALLRGKQHLAEQAITNLAAVNMLEASFW